jgi:RNA polymerase sigma factor (sigma-70 family)
MARGSPLELDRISRFREAALPHFNAIYGFAYRLLRNRADAEDAVQECYLRALRYYDGQSGATARAWLFAIARNICCTELARSRTRETASEFTEESAEAALWIQTPDRPDDLTIRAQDITELQRRIDALPATYREVLVLREFSEASYTEIAKIIGAPVGTVMSRLARARALLTASEDFSNKAITVATALQPAGSKTAS